MANHCACVLVVIATTILAPLFMLPLSIIQRACSHSPTNYSDHLSMCLLTMLKAEHAWHCESERLIEKGFILSNHRCLIDMIIDPFLSNASGVGRLGAYVAVPFASMLAMLDRRLVVINRKHTRQAGFQKMIAHFNSQSPGRYNRRLMFYPEGSRMRHACPMSVDEARVRLRPGLLKSIYEYRNLPVQIMITSNKEMLMDERRVQIGLNVRLVTSLSVAIFPERFETFEAFYTAVALSWLSEWKRAYSADGQEGRVVFPDPLLNGT